MLGACALLAMLVGALAMAGGIFDWEFLFSDGRTAHEWVASMGRAAARTLIGLGGGGLLALGFVLRVMAVAEMPLDASPALGDSSSSSAQPGDIGSPPKHALEPTSAAADSRDRDDKTPTASARGNLTTTVPETLSAKSPPPPPESALQAVTLWNPTATLEPQGTTLFTVEYRFEVGHRPRPGEQYAWVIDLSDKTRAVQYEGDVLQTRGQLRHVIHTPAELRGGLGSWHMALKRGSDDAAPDVSNRLTINGDRVDSIPLAP
ncbi:MAG TPA: hypothetical protein VJ783_16805 [Pirellulales bacterium]|nr:hypothetical protein [Pirellulales bacterium]